MGFLLGFVARPDLVLGRGTFATMILFRTSSVNGAPFAPRSQSE
jgi:hypothetical protein